ncbi:D-serine dehydratase [Salmonella enterica subsp. enterica]|uniref:D-serine dehydratase n=1 Tax=Salmonella enterica I TaxID=59201 RepID=A0A379WJP5_SALET|nr:D-serine dehydratase [Salmonella enterica subsp. enterica serovar Hartford]SUG63524.1 D-serine dehydratase [Salmonella enterica subsp. enterica]SUH33901.1 D-serine dehydratase [Salmonella enterica subsp. enterica]
MENIQKLIARYPLVEDLVALKETTWFNPAPPLLHKVYRMSA